jgi:hypothetical protein
MMEEEAARQALIDAELARERSARAFAEERLALPRFNRLRQVFNDDPAAAAELVTFVRELMADEDRVNPPTRSLTDDISTEEALGRLRIVQEDPAQPSGPADAAKK